MESLKNSYSMLERLETMYPIVQSVIQVADTDRLPQGHRPEPPRLSNCPELSRRQVGFFLEINEYLNDAVRSDYSEIIGNYLSKYFQYIRSRWLCSQGYCYVKISLLDHVSWNITNNVIIIVKDLTCVTFKRGYVKQVELFW